MDFTEEIDLTECLYFNFLVLKIFGFWLPERFKGTYMEAFYKIYSMFMRTFLFYMFFASEVINIFKVFGDIEAAIDSSFLTLTHCAEFVKLYNIMHYRDKIKAILDKLNEPRFRIIHKDSANAVKKEMWIVRTNTIVLQGMATATCILWAMFPYIEDYENIRLPLRGWFPYDTSISPNFELTFGFQITGAYTNALCICAMDLIASGLMSLCTGQFQVLCDQLKRMPVNYEKNDYQNDHCKDSATMIYLKDFVKRHNDLIRLVEDFEKIFKQSAAVQFGVDTVIMGITAFKILLTPLSMELISMVLYLNCMLVELLLYCYFGNELMLMSVRVTDAAFESQWRFCGTKERRMLLIIMQRSAKPVAVTAGKIFNLSLQTFTSILRVSYSYFAVLQCVYKDK